MSIASLFNGINEFVLRIKAMLGLLAFSYTRLYTNDVDGVLVCDNSSMVSIMQFDGSLQMIGDDEFAELIEQLGIVLQVPLSKRCHTVQFAFQYDPEYARKNIHEHFSKIAQEASHLQLDLKGVLQDWEKKVASFCAHESCYLAFWTQPGALSQAELKSEKKRLGRENLLANPLRQGKSVIIERLRDLHTSQVTKLVDFFASRRCKVKLLDSRSACLTLRRLIAPDSTSMAWRPWLAGDTGWVEEKEDGANPYDVSHLLPPTIARQIWPHNARVIDSRYVRIGSRVYAPFVMTLAPHNLLPFNTLFQNMKGDMPWRMCITLSGDGLGKMNLKNLFAQVLSFTHSGNQKFMNAFRALQEASLEGECITGFQAAFVTWVDCLSAHPYERLARRSARFQSQVQAWGGADTCDEVGDPLLAFSASLPALMPNSPAPKALAPLKDALSLLPISRATSPWDLCDVPLRSPDGKFMPVGLFHSAQASWNEIVFAGMGAGKSFFLNTLNFFFLLRAGEPRLPWLTVIDIGPSCSGVINLVKWALPSELQHLAVFVKLKNLPKFSINPFDTPLGCPYPLRNHLEFLNNLLQLICTPLDQNAPADGIPQLLRDAVDALYKDLAPYGDHPKRFDPYLDEEVTAHLKAIGCPWDAQSTWWEVVDALFDAGEYALALRAQRFAMPLISDLACVVTEQNVAENYVGISAGAGGENVPSACARHLVSAIKEYPILSSYTRFSLGSAKIIGLDLYDVTPRGGAQAQRQSGIMYMLARFVGAAHFFNSPDDLEQIPPKYRAYHRPRFESLAADPKRLCYDEFHRASCQDMSNPLSKQIISDLTTATREARKLNLSIGLYSQRLDDFPKELVSMATSIYALGCGNQEEAKEIAERFGLNHAAYHALRHITRPNAHGASFIAVYRTEKGECIQHLTNSAGSYARWAFSTTAEDMRLRNALYDRLGCRKALNLLQRFYPKGSIKEELEQRKMLLGDRADAQKIEDIEKKMLEELLQRAQEIVWKEDGKENWQEEGEEKEGEK